MQVFGEDEKINIFFDYILSKFTGTHIIDELRKFTKKDYKFSLPYASIDKEAKCFSFESGWDEENPWFNLFKEIANEFEVDFLLTREAVSFYDYIFEIEKYWYKTKKENKYILTADEFESIRVYNNSDGISCFRYKKKRYEYWDQSLLLSIIMKEEYGEDVFSMNAL
jgi:hypothetical protein